MNQGLHPRQLDALIKRIREFFMIAQREDQAVADGAPLRRMYTSGNRGLRLSATSEAAFEKLIDGLLKANALREHIPRKTLSQELMSALLNSQTDDDIGELVTRLVSEFTDDIKLRYAYIPIGGIDFESKTSFEFGDLVLRKFDDDEAFRRTFGDRFAGVLHDDLTDEKRESEEAWFRKQLRTLSWRPTLIVPIDTSTDNVRNLVFDRVQPIADFWQFCVGTVMPDDWVSLVDFRVNALLRGIEPFPVIAADGTSVDLPVLPGGAPAVLFTKERLAWLESIGLWQIKDLFAIPNGDEGDSFDALLRRAIQNFADAERSSSNRQKLLSYTAAAELFFSSKTDTTNVVTHGIAKTLAEYQSSPYRMMLREASAMYEARSRVIHDGVTPSSDDIRRFSAISYSVILAMVGRRGEFANHAEIARWSDPPSPFRRDPRSWLRNFPKRLFRRS